MRNIEHKKCHSENQVLIIYLDS